MKCCDVMDILRFLGTGTEVFVWFDNSGFPFPTFFQFYEDNQVAFTGLAFGAGLTYIQATDIRAIRVSEPIPVCDELCDTVKRNGCRNDRVDDCLCCNPMSILKRLPPDSSVSVWFDSSQFQQTTFKFLCGNMAVFSGGSLDGGYTYIKASDIRAITTSVAPNCTSDCKSDCDERKCRKNRKEENCCYPMSVLNQISQGATVSVWFDSSGSQFGSFRPTLFHCIENDMSIFTGGAFGAGYTYIKSCDIRAIQIGTGTIVPTAANEEAKISIANLVEGKE
ncbi:MAG: hypothetical protein Q8934_07395 [Bacillota bacterium]|nr:hypothetical protein [Bacillota bacterium]